MVGAERIELLRQPPHFFYDNEVTARRGERRPWWTRPGTIRQPPDCKSGALPIELRAHGGPCGNCTRLKPRCERGETLLPPTAPEFLMARPNGGTRSNVGPRFGRPHASGLYRMDAPNVE